MKPEYLFIMTGVAGLTMFKLFVVNPAYQKLPDGCYGEMYGPVSNLKMEIYVFFAILIILGLIIMIWKKVASKINDIKKDK